METSSEVETFSTKSDVEDGGNICFTSVDIYITLMQLFK
jgi:hypothetical protein